MKQLDKDTINAIYTLGFEVKTPIIVLSTILGVFIGFAVGLWLKSWFVFWLCLIGTPAVLSYLFIYKPLKKKIGKINSLYREMFEGIKNTLKRTDYYNTSENGAIGVDAENKSIVIFSADEKFKLQPPYVLTPDKIKNYKAYMPGTTEWDSVGNTDFTENSEMLRKNLQSKSAAHAKSGIYINLDDVNKPQVFVQMEYSEAEKWLLILEKLLDGTLETQKSPMYYPQA